MSPAVYGYDSYLYLDEPEIQETPSMLGQGESNLSLFVFFYCLFVWEGCTFATVLTHAKGRLSGLGSLVR